MKKVIIFLAVIVFVGNVYGQAINSFNYQAIIRDAEGEVMANEQVNLTINLLQGTANGTVVYTETHDSTTNDYGLVNLHIGAGDPAGFDSIDWSRGPYYINIKLSGNSISTSQLQSVPYAMYAKSSQESKLLKERLALVENMLMENDLYTVEDYDGNKYKAVRIGEQVWMAENLRTTKYNDGTPIPLVTQFTAWENLTTPGYCWWANDSATYAQTYGALYNWYTVNTKNLCPVGWHVPTDAEWTKLTDYLGGDSIAGGKLKETGTAHWPSPNAGATNETGFTALPGGLRADEGSFFSHPYLGEFWSVTEISISSAWCRNMRYDSSNIIRGQGAKRGGFSVRCLRD